MDKQPILEICIPTYNRKDVLILDVKRYLASSDRRYRIVIQDNASTDNTKDEIKKLNNPRIKYRRNKENFGGPVNGLKALANNEADYLLFVIDKDQVQIEELSAFIDFLEENSPDFGYINLQIENNNSTVFYNKGYEAAANLGFLSKHPSGYFFKRKLFDEVINTDWFKSLPSSFDFNLDIVAGALSINHAGVVYGKPLIRNANYRKFPTTIKTLTYNNDNFYFSPQVVITTMKYYLKCVFANSLDLKLIKRICRVILSREANRVTFGYKLLLDNKKICDYYGLQMRCLSFVDMYKYLNKLTIEFANFSQAKIPIFSIRKMIFEVKIKYIISYIKMQMMKIIKIF